MVSGCNVFGDLWGHMVARCIVCGDMVTKCIVCGDIWLQSALFLQIGGDIWLLVHCLWRSVEIFVSAKEFVPRELVSTGNLVLCLWRETEYIWGNPSTMKAIQ